MELMFSELNVSQLIHVSVFLPLQRAFVVALVFRLELTEVVYEVYSICEHSSEFVIFTEMF